MKAPSCEFAAGQGWDGQRMRGSGAAFTLIELLVVVAIIALLAALLLPALAQAKARARLAGCLNNERQLALAWINYTEDNGDLLALNGTPTRSSRYPLPASPKLWVAGIFSDRGDSTNVNLLLNPDWALFAPYLKTVQIYHCPADTELVDVAGISNLRSVNVRSYSMNCKMGASWMNIDGRLYPGWFSYLSFQRSAQVGVARPADLFVFLDVYAQSICHPFFGVYLAEDAFFNFPAAYHNRSGVLGFADGHVERHRWMDPRTTSPQSPNFHAHHDPSPNNPDLAWLRQRTSRPGDGW